MNKIFTFFPICILYFLYVNYLSAQTGPEIMAEIVTQYKKAKNIDLKLSIYTAYKNNEPNDFEEINWMANDSDDIYIYSTKNNSEKLIGEFIFTKYKNNPMGAYYRKSYNDQKQDSAYRGMAYILAGGGMVYTIFQNLFYKGHAPFSLRKINTSRDYTCWVREADTSIIGKEYFVLSMVDTLFYTTEMNTMMKNFRNIARDSLNLKHAPPPYKDKTYTANYYKLLVQKSSYALHNVVYKMSGEDLDVTTIAKVNCTLHQEPIKFAEELKKMRGK